MKCALEMMTEINTLKHIDAMKAEAERLENLNKLKATLTENKEKFFDLIAKEMLEKRATSVSFTMDKVWGSDTYGLDGTILCVPEKRYYANGRWNGYSRPCKTDGIWLEDIAKDLYKLCYTVSTSTVRSPKFYTHSKRDTFGDTDLIKLTISIDPNCIA